MNRGHDQDATILEATPEQALLPDLIEAALRPGRNKLTFMIIPQAHIDLAWKWMWADTMGMIRDTFSGHATLLEQHPTYTYAQSQPAAYRAVEQHYPELFERIRRLVEQGCWALVGGEYVECDHNLLCGESLARQFLFGQRYFQEKFGRTAAIGWSPDSFGHSANLPQILAQSGIKAFVFKRPRYKFLPLFEVPFRWRGLDGTQIVAKRTNNKGRGLPVQPERFAPPRNVPYVRHLQEESERLSIHHFWGPLGCGDTGGVNTYPQEAHTQQWELVYARPEDYFSKLQSVADRLPLFQGEMNGIFPACYTTHLDMKQANRSCENLLLSAESLSVLAGQWGFAYPTDQLREAWRRVLFNQFHDILPGTGIAKVHQQARHHYAEAQQIATDILDRVGHFIMEKVDTTSHTGRPILLLNPLPWPRTERIEVEVDVTASDFPYYELVDETGAGHHGVMLDERALQGLHKRRLAFLAEDLPPWGYRTYWLREGSPPAAPRTAQPNAIENDRFRIVGDATTGFLSSVYDKANQREWVSPGQALARWRVLEEGLFELDYGDEMKAWNFGFTGKTDVPDRSTPPAVTQESALGAVLALRHHFRDSTFQQDVRLFDGLDRVDVLVTVDWQEQEHCARLEFPLNVSAEGCQFVCHIPFGALQRPADGAEVPCLYWVDVSEPGGPGVALLNNGRYGFSMHGNVLRMTVVRWSTSPDPCSDRGTFRFAYSLFPHKEPWDGSEVARRAFEFNRPVWAVDGPSSSGKLPSCHQGNEIGPPNVITSAIKQGEGGGVLIRLFETCGRETDVQLPLPEGTSKASETNLIETKRRPLEVKRGRALLHLRPYEIKTVLCCGPVEQA